MNTSSTCVCRRDEEILSSRINISGQLVKAMLEDEIIESEIFWHDSPDARTSIPERPYQLQIT